MTPGTFLWRADPSNKGLKQGFQVTISAKNLQKINFSPSAQTAGALTIRPSVSFLIKQAYVGLHQFGALALSCLLLSLVLEEVGGITPAKLLFAICCQG